MNRQAHILCFRESSEQARRLARAAGLPCAEISVHRFPDGESLLTLPTVLSPHVIIFRSLDRPNDKLLEILLVAKGLREQSSIEKLTLVAPYLCYMRQDKAFHPGEIISQQAVGQLLADHFDAVLTVDSHLHRVRSLRQAVPAKTAINLLATRSLAAFLRQQFDNPVLLGPDSESRQWVAAIAGALHSGVAEYCVASKQRHDDTHVEIALPEFDFSGRHVILVDDVASTGRTLEQTARALAKHAPASVSVLVTHALFVGDALKRLYASGVNNIWSSDSVTHPTNHIALDTVLKEGLDICNTA